METFKFLVSHEGHGPDQGHKVVGRQESNSLEGTIIFLGPQFSKTSKPTATTPFALQCVAQSPPLCTFTQK